jgi:hypothetical protein
VATGNPDLVDRDHPNRPSRLVLLLAFAGILFAGALGGAIGWGVVGTSCTEVPAVGDQLLEAIPGMTAPEHSCDAPRVAAALAGAAIAAIGAGVVGALMLRAQSEWRAHPPESTDQVTRSRSGGNPPHT